MNAVAIGILATGSSAPRSKRSQHAHSLRSDTAQAAAHAKQHTRSTRACAGNERACYKSVSSNVRAGAQPLRFRAALGHGKYGYSSQVRARPLRRPLVRASNDAEPSEQTESAIDWTATGVAFLFPALCGLLFGFDIGATSGALVNLTSADTGGVDWYALSPLQSGLVVSGSLAGALTASAAALVFGDQLGRKRELLAAAGLYAAGSAGMWAAPSLPVLLLGRFAYGLGIGFAMHAAPMYIAETAPARVRGTLISLKEGFIVGGILLGYLASAAFIDEQAGWRSIYLASALPALVTAAGIATALPESPRWLLLSGRGREPASKALQQLRGSSGTPEALDAELAEMAATSDGTAGGEGQEAEAEGVGAKLWSNRKALYAGLSLVVFQQITGQPSVLYYATDIFQKVGFGAGGEASGVAVGLGAFKLAMTFVAVGTVDRWGRRPLLLGGVGALTAALLALSALQTDALQGLDNAAYANVAALLLYVGAYQVSFGPIAWLVVGEVFPLEVRSAAVGCATLANFGTNFGVSLVLPAVQRELGQGGTYLLFAGLGAVAMGSIFATLPETKGRSLEQIQELFRTDDSGNRLALAGAGAAAGGEAAAGPPPTLLAADSAGDSSSSSSGLDGAAGEVAAGRGAEPETAEEAEANAIAAVKRAEELNDLAARLMQESDEAGEAAEAAAADAATARDAAQSVAEAASKANEGQASTSKEEASKQLLGASKTALEKSNEAEAALIKAQDLQARAEEAGEQALNAAVDAEVAIEIAVALADAEKSAK